MKANHSSLEVTVLFVKNLHTKIINMQLSTAGTSAAKVATDIPFLVQEWASPLCCGSIPKIGLGLLQQTTIMIMFPVKPCIYISL